MSSIPTLTSTIRLTVAALVREVPATCAHGVAPNQLGLFVVHISSPLYADMKQSDAFEMPDDCLGKLLNMTGPNGEVFPDGFMGTVIAIGDQLESGLMPVALSAPPT